MIEGIGEEFQEKTKHQRKRMVGRGLDWENKPDAYKTYPSATSISLSLKMPEKSLAIDQALKKRKSIRSFTTEPVAIDDLSFLLWASTGEQRKEQGYHFRTVPSAGALYPIETYLVVNNVTGLNPGLYHYDVEVHGLEELKQGDLSESLVHAALEQKVCARAAVVFVWTAVFERSKWKYDQRAYRYIYLDAGHIAQSLGFCATALNLGVCHIGAFFDEEVNEILGVDGKNESVVYLTVLGNPMK